MFLGWWPSMKLLQAMLFGKKVIVVGMTNHIAIPRWAIKGPLAFDFPHFPEKEINVFLTKQSWLLDLVQYIVEKVDNNVAWNISSFPTMFLNKCILQRLHNGYKAKGYVTFDCMFILGDTFDIWLINMIMRAFNFIWVLTLSHIQTLS